MPLAAHEGLVSGVAENLGKRNDALIQVALVAGHATLRRGIELAALGTILTRHVRPLDVAKYELLIGYWCSDVIKETPEHLHSLRNIQRRLAH